MGDIDCSAEIAEEETPTGDPVIDCGTDSQEMRKADCDTSDLGGKTTAAQGKRERKSKDEEHAEEYKGRRRREKDAEGKDKKRRRGEDAEKDRGRRRREKDVEGKERKRRRDKDSEEDKGRRRRDK